MGGQRANVRVVRWRMGGGKGLGRTHPWAGLVLMKGIWIAGASS